MQIYLYGAGITATKILKRYDKNKFAGIIDRNKNGIFNELEILKLEQIPTEAMIIITNQRGHDVVEIFKELSACGYKKVFYYDVDLERYNLRQDDIFICCREMPKWTSPILPYLEMHLSDKCNLNCKGCTHFAPLFDEVGVTVEGITKDLKKIKQKKLEIFKLRFLGGEPFLQPDIETILRQTRELFPYTDIRIVTNGILIPSISDALLSCIKELGIKVDISRYKPTDKILDKIIQRLEKRKILYRVNSDKSIEEFCKPLSLSCDSKYPRICMSNICVNIWNGKIARCPVLMFINKLNETFGVNFPNEGIWDLDEFYDANDIVVEMQKEIPLCRHCVENMIPWELCNQKVKLEDFITCD